MCPEFLLYNKFNQSLVSYLVVNLHLQCELRAIECVLTWVVELDILRVPLDHLCNGVVRGLRREGLPKVSPHCVGEIGGAILAGGDRGFVGGEERELETLFRVVPVHALLQEINGGLLLLGVVAVHKGPVCAVLVIVPVRVPVTHYPAVLLHVLNPLLDEFWCLSEDGCRC